MTTAFRVEIPLQQVPNQTLYTSLGGQNITIAIRTMGDSIFTDLYLDNNVILYGARAVHGINVNQYISDFLGYLMWYSDNGDDPDDYTELGTKFHLYFANYNMQQVLYDNWVYSNYGA